MNQIDHDPDEFREPFLIRIIPGVQVFVMVGIALAATLYFRPVPGFSWADAVASVVFLALLGWCFVERDPTVDADGHQSAGQRLAFRLGKKLHDVLKLLRRDSAVRD